MKVQITMDDALVKRMDKAVEDNYTSRSGLISMALVQYLNQNEVVSAVRDLSLALRKIADTGSVDEQTQQQLDDFSRLAVLLTGK